MRLLPLCPSNAGSAGARASAYIPPTNACVATSVFETPSVLRESLPSYSAKPGAFYAPRALRWTTPPRGRTDPFQGPKIKPMFRRCSFFKTILGSKMEANMRSTSSYNRAWAPSKTLLEPGVGRWGFLKLWGAFWDSPEPRKSCSRHNAGSISANLADRARGSKIDLILVQNRSQKPPRGVQMGYKAVS